MSPLKSIFASSEPKGPYSLFWEWFEKNQQRFYQEVKNQNNIKEVFFAELEPKLDAVHEGIWFLAGMVNDQTAELILTADGVIKNFVFIEELVAAAPEMDNWKITALKQPAASNGYGIEMDGFKFDDTTMAFYANAIDHMPDEIDITIAHNDYAKENKKHITNGVYMAIDTKLGELNSLTTIDNISVINPKDATAELIPMEKLGAFLHWRQKEFVEKYGEIRRNTENDKYASLEGTLSNGLPLFAIINTDVLNWDGKASHPWISVIECKYNGEENNGMPDAPTYDLLNKIEDRIMEELKDTEGYLNIGRQTAYSVREIYFACAAFRKPSKVLHVIKSEYENQIDFDFHIYKDKYWRSFDRFIPR